MQKEWHILWATEDCGKGKVELVLKGTDSKLWVPHFKQVIGQDKDVVPLYPSYYFVECTEETIANIEERINAIRSKGKLVFMKTDDKKLNTLTQEEIDRIKTVEMEEIDRSEFMEDDNIRVIGGLFRGCTGKTVEVRRDAVKITTMMFGRELDSGWISNEFCEKIK